MKGEIAQIVALACHGNAFLQGYPTTQFFPNNSTCQYCERVSFVDLKRRFFHRMKEIEIAENPDDWFGLLKSQGAFGIRVYRVRQDNPHIPDRMAAAFVGGGGTWMMEVLFAKRTSEIWAARWKMPDRQTSSKRRWRITYGRFSGRRPNDPEEGRLSAAFYELEASLKDIRAFSVRLSLDGFTQSFDNALDTLSTEGRNRHGYHKDLLPVDFPSADAATLLDACQSSWVFGGMGSWNDLGFSGEDGEEYARVSERLFEAINMAIERAATSTVKSDQPTG